MYLYQYALLAGFTCLLFNPKTRFASSVFLIGWLVYVTFLIDSASNLKYICCASIEVAISYAINNRFKVASYLGYLLIPVNMYGLMLIRLGAQPITYDVVYAIIAIIQFMLILDRAIPDGIYRLHFKRWMVRPAHFDSR
jgi:hypothetical protein